MADRGHVLTDELLKKLEKDIAKEYRKASKDAAAKLKAYLEEDEAKRKVQESLLKAGKITQKQYNDWVFRHTMIGNRWKDMQEVLAKDFLNANKIALQIAKNRMPDVYALNANYATYQLEHDGKLDTSFVLYNHDTAEYLLEQERQLMPGPSARKAKEIAQNKDLQWNKRKIQSAVLQGVLQGESPYEVAKRLMDVGQMNYNSAVRYARTMGTNAQNAGRYQAYRRADALGVDLTIEWQATLDGRTRHEHRLMHGQRRDVGQPFVIDGVEILWPAQPNYNGENIPQELIWNCRCTLLSWVKGFEGDTVKSSPKMGNMSFEEWQKAKAPKQKEEKFTSRFKPATTIEEAEAFAKLFCDTTRWGATGISYKGVDVEVANRVNKALVDLYDEFDIKRFGGIIAPAGNTREGKLISDATAAYSSSRHSFLLNRKAFGTVKSAEAYFAKNRSIIQDFLTNPQKYDLSRASKATQQILLASKISGRDVVPSSIEGAIFHEFGHSLERGLRNLDNYAVLVQNMNKYAPSISGYATSEFSEYVAESFASWRLGEKKLDPELEKAFKRLRRRK